MALINCPDCKREVSERAPSCPQCGAPIATAAEARAIGVPVQTVEATAKALKGRIAVSALMFWGGMFMVASFDSTLAPWGAAICAVGLMLYLATKARIWWHHS